MLNAYSSSQKMEWMGQWLVFGVLAIGLFGLPVFANAERDVRPTAQDLVRGKRIFVKYCSSCHGPSGRGDGYRLLGPSPADLTASATRQQADEDHLKTIHEGKPNMPAWKLRLSKKDSMDVLNYIRSFTEQ